MAAAFSALEAGTEEQLQPVGQARQIASSIDAEAKVSERVQQLSTVELVA